jgi:D-alanine-D-alanine ligase
MAKIRVGILFGGKSAEHEVSLLSAKNVMAAMDPEKYEIVPIGISRTGEWFRSNAITLPERADAQQLSLIPGSTNQSIVENEQPLPALDVIFPVLHGSNGEDGTVQGLLRLANIPFIGADVLGSAIGMDKDVAKRLLRDAGIPVADFVVIHNYDRDSYTYEKLTETLGSPIFVKAVNMGSSVGVTKVKNQIDFDAAMSEAFRYDTKVIVEAAINGREIECAVLGNDKPEASTVGEIIPDADFYTYEAKYTEGATKIIIPADLPQKTLHEAQQLAIKTFQVLECTGMARVDFFLEESGRLLVNEINTIPGFTKTSMYPKLWEASGLVYDKLIEKLIALAIERHQQRERLAID